MSVLVVPKITAQALRELTGERGPMLRSCW